MKAIEMVKCEDCGKFIQKSIRNVHQCEAES